MLVRAVIVGIDHWQDLTRRFALQLARRNPGMEVLVVDNASQSPYPLLPRVVLARLTERAGYGAALNIGAKIGGGWDWLLCCNNDCTCEDGVLEAISRLDPGTIYGNDWKINCEEMKRGLPAVVDSAYLLISRLVWDTLGGFDPLMDAAFEEIDLQIRAIDLGFRVDVAQLSITHLDKHTRWELEGYGERWTRTEKYFHKKYPNRDPNGCRVKQEVTSEPG